MFRGTLDDFTLPEILRMLAFSKKSGTLHVARKAGTGRITFSQGNVVYAETELSNSRLGQKLVGAGKISPARLRQALDVQVTSGARLGRVLLGAEMVTKDDLHQALQAQVEEAAYELMCWEAGEFSWEPGAEEADAEVTLDIEELMREVENRLAQRAEVQLQLSRPGAVPRMVEHAPHGPGDINIRPEQWRVLVLVDGRRAVGDLALAAGIAEADVVRTLNDLAAAGLVEVHDEVEPPVSRVEPPRAPVSQDHRRDGATNAPAPEAADSENEPAPAAFAAAAATTSAPGPAGEGTAEPPEEWFEDPDEASDEGLSVAFPPPEPAVEDLPRVDRAAAVKELSGLFDEPKGAPKPPPPRRPQPQDESEPKGFRRRPRRPPA